MPNRALFIISAILFGVGFVLTVLGIDRYTMAFVLAGLTAFAAAHVV